MPAHKEVAEKSSSELAILDPALFEEDANMGTVDLGEDDLALPWLKIVSGQEDGDVNGKKGSIWNTVTGECFDGDEGIKVISCAYQRRFIEWAPRGSGTGAPVKIYEPGDVMPETVRDENNKDMIVDGDGNYLEETHQHYVLVLDGETFSPALIAMKSTQLKKSRKWNSMIVNRTMTNAEGKTFRPARFSHVYTLTSTQESNSKGNWYGWEISCDGPIDNANFYREAKAFNEQIASGDVNVKHEQDGEVGENSTPF
jgi:hypothetical protein